MLETLLAASIGAVLVLVVMGVMASMDATQAAVARRQDQIDALARLHLVMDRTLGKLVMASTSRGPAPNPGTTRAAAQPALQKDAARNDVKEQPPRARMVLEIDQGAASASFQ